MTRRITLLFVFLLLCASSAWPKFNDDDKKYLDDQFRSIQDQVQAMQNQIQTLNTQLQQLKENQAQLQAFIVKQQHAINDINQLVSSMSLGSEEHYSKLKALLDKLGTDTQASFNKISPGAGGPGGAQAGGGGGATGGGGSSTSGGGVVSPPPPPVTSGYITSVEGNNVLVDLSSAQGVQQGTRLALYKASDPNTRVGVLEVTQVMDSGSRARIITINSGVKPEFGDSVRIEK